jgi:hypothetical protein
VIKMAQKRKSINVPKQMQERFEEVSGILTTHISLKSNSIFLFDYY